MKNEDLLKENIQLILNYNERSIVIEVKKYKTLEEIKDKVYDLFYPIKNEINIYLNQKNLEPLNDQPVGYVFSGKSIVNLKIIDVGVIDSPYKLVKRFKDPNIINDVTNLYSRLNFQQTNKKFNITSLNNETMDKENKNIIKNQMKDKSLLLSKNKLILLKSELNKNDEVKPGKKLFSNNSVDNLKIETNKKNVKFKGKLPPITQKRSSKINLNIDIITKKANSRIDSSKTKKNKSMTNILYNKCNNCFINKISKYCRLCNTFLCQNCSTNKKTTHQEHKEHFINLDIVNNIDNINKYKDLLTSDFTKSLNYFENIEKKDSEPIIENEESRIEKFSYDKIIENLDENVQKLVKKAYNMKNSMKKFEFNEQVNDDEEKVKEICDNEKKVLKNFDVYEYKSQIQPFFVLNKFERNMAKYFNNYEASNDQRIYIKSQIELMFDNVENEVDGVLDDIEKIIGNIKI